MSEELKTTNQEIVTAVSRVIQRKNHESNDMMKND